jgi:hypothetical protein
LSEAPASLQGSEVFLRLRISDAPLWEHVRFRLRGLQESYWEARIANSG